MALQIRRGSEAERSAVTPAVGELLYTTDEKLVYVGDGTTVGGNLLAGGGSGSLNNLVEDTTPQLGGNLEVNGFSITSSSGDNIAIDTTANILLNGSLRVNGDGDLRKTGILSIAPTDLLRIGDETSSVNGNLYIVRNSYSGTFGQGITFAQHHSTADAVNFNFLRTRGTGFVPQAVSVGDDIADLNFIGHDGTNRVSIGGITARVSGAVSTGIVPGEINFDTRSISGTLSQKATLTSEGVWKVNGIENYSGTDLTLTATTVNVAGDLQLNNRGDLKFADADSSNYVAFQAPAVVSNNVTWTLPATDGTSGQLLSTDGTGTLGWTTVSGGGGGALSSRTVVNATTASLNNNATENISITGAKGYVLYKIETTAASWIRIYTDEASRSADSTRLEGTDPLPGSGVIAEIITTGADTILMSPGVIGFNTEAVVSDAIACAVTNTSGAPVAITVSLTILTIEV